MNGTQMMADALVQPRDAILTHFSRELAEALPEHVILETEDGAFNFHTFAHDGKCTMEAKPNVHQMWEYYWDRFHEKIVGTIYNAWHLIEWEGHLLEVVSIGVWEQHQRSIRHYLVGTSAEATNGFFEAVCRYCSEVRGEILVFSEGCWSKSADLYESIKQTSLDNLVLAESLKEEIIADFTQFFECKETYNKYKIPWKRGVLFLGSPGNGKTHAIKGLINQLGRPCLYVRSFSAEYGSDHSCISSAFARARESAPCMFILEDLDSLVNDENRSFFLNELDGFYANEGILTLATTNHPERLDPAILDRPSRFDRKYTFHLPGLEERSRYLALFGEKLDPQLRLSQSGVELVANLTEEFSFAYLKELFLSSMMTWVSNPEAFSMDQVMSSHVETLKEQMKTAEDIAPVFELDDDSDVPAYVPRSLRAHYQRMKRAGRR
ncbi:MAG: ATP-binding protein [Fimbriimonadaceae bacterium]